MSMNLTAKDWPEAFRVSRSDPRLSYCRHIAKDASEATELLVVIHGSERNAMGMRDAFALHPETRDMNILAPLFPVSPFGDGNGDGYKYLQERDLRFDHALLDMVDEFAATSQGRFDRFHIFGFSGGGHFAHRFAYMHPRKLLSATVGAPGRVTLADLATDWPDGLAGVDTVLGAGPDLAALQDVPVQLLCGDLDTQPMPTVAGRSAGANRAERIAALHDSYVAAGISAQLDFVPGARHEWAKMVGKAGDFIGKVRKG
jgi:dienelactone hydrolase